MAEIRPVVGQVGGSDRFQSSNRHNNQDPFSITGEVVPPVKSADSNAAADAKNQMQQQQSNLLMELSKDILKPIQDKTNIQSSELRDLLAASKLFEVSSGKMSGELMKKIFISPEELQANLLSKDKGETNFSGEAFDILRLISKLNLKQTDAASAAKTLAQLAQNSTQANEATAQAAAMAEAVENVAVMVDEDGMEIPPALAASLAELEGEAVVSEFTLSPTEELVNLQGAEKVVEEQTGLTDALAKAVNGNQMSVGSKDIQNSIVSILRHFDCYSNQDQSLQAIVQQLSDLQGKVFTGDRGLLQNFIDQLSSLMKETEGTSDGFSNPYSQVQNALEGTDVMRADEEAMGKTQAFLKDELVPTLSKLVNKYNQADRVRNPVMSIIHYVTRYDKADPSKLAKAVDQMGEALKDIPSLTEKDISELKDLIMDSAKDIRVEQKIENVEKDYLAKFGGSPEKTDVIGLLSQSLDEESPARVQKLALNLLTTMVENESPVMPLMHFMVPIDYNGSNTFLEMYVDKECEGRKGKADSAVNIFFTIDSEDYGTFEVDMLERDGMIDLDIKAPAELQKEVKSAKNNIRAAIENSGFKLALYRVAAYNQSTSAASHFRELREKNSGLDVKI